MQASTSCCSLQHPLFCGGRQRDRQSAHNPRTELHITAFTAQTPPGLNGSPAPGCHTRPYSCHGGDILALRVVNDAASEPPVNSCSASVSAAFLLPPWSNMLQQQCLVPASATAAAAGTPGSMATVQRHEETAEQQQGSPTAQVEHSHRSEHIYSITPLSQMGQCHIQWQAVLDCYKS